MNRKIEIEKRAFLLLFLLFFFLFGAKKLKKYLINLTKYIFYILDYGKTDCDKRKKREEEGMKIVYINIMYNFHDFNLFLFYLQTRKRIFC